MKVYTLSYSHLTAEGWWVDRTRVFSSESERDAEYDRLDSEMGYINLWGDSTTVE